MHRGLLLLALGAVVAGTPAQAQIGLPRISLPVLSTPTLPLNDALKTARDAAGETAQRLLTVRIERIDRLLQSFPDLIELDAHGDPARRGELLVIGAAPAELRAAQDAGTAPRRGGGAGRRGADLVYLAGAGARHRRLQRLS